MSEKKLEKGSTWEAADLDHDGIITDEEIQLTEKMIQLENNDKMADQQRMMVWVSLISVIVFVGIMLTPLVSIERVDTLISFASTWVIANMGIIATFIAGSAWVKTKENNNN